MVGHPREDGIGNALCAAFAAVVCARVYVSLEASAVIGYTVPSTEGFPFRFDGLKILSVGKPCTPYSPQVRLFLSPSQSMAATLTMPLSELATLS